MSQHKVKMYTNFISRVDEQQRETSLVAYRSFKQEKLKYSHGFSIKYCMDTLKELESGKDEGIVAILKKARDLRDNN